MSHFKALSVTLALALAAPAPPAAGDGGRAPPDAATELCFPDYPDALSQAWREDRAVAVFANLPPAPVPGMVAAVDKKNLLKVGPYNRGVCLFWYDPARGWVSKWVDCYDFRMGGVEYLTAEYRYRRYGR